jgi:hypothetical protein
MPYLPRPPPSSPVPVVSKDFSKPSTEPQTFFGAFKGLAFPPKQKSEKFTPHRKQELGIP